MTIEILSSTEQKLDTKRPLFDLLLQGLQLCMRNWPCLMWAYGVSLVFAFMAGIPLSGGLSPYLDHSLAGQNIAGTINLSYLGELALQLRDTGFFPIAFQTAQWLNLVQVLVLFVLFAGTIFVFVSAEPPRFSVLLRGGIGYLWRFVRAAILAGLVATVILSLLLGVRGLLLGRAESAYVGGQIAVYSVLSAALIVLVGLVVRFWWDLVEVYIVRNGMDGERSVRRALLPAFRLLRSDGLRGFGSFILAGLAGLLGFALCLFIWRLVPAHQVWLACLVGQLSIFLLLAGRFWQRGVGAVLVMSQAPPRIFRDEVVTEAIVEEEVAVTTASSNYLSDLAEPTLRDLVLKLKTEPLANPEILAAALPATAPASDRAPAPVEPLHPMEKSEPRISLVDQHEAKFPLGGVKPVKESAQPEPAEKPADRSSNTPVADEKPKP